MALTVDISSPPLIEGDSLTTAEFLIRWDGMPDVKHAELIDGIVYMPSPVSRTHGEYEFFLSSWLTFYALGTPGCRGNMEATWLMGESQAPQPDVTLRILPEYGGKPESPGNLFAGAPELIVELAVSSYSRDFGAKKRLYERMGVLEYFIVVPGEKKLVSLTLTSSGYQLMEADSGGVIRSICFPGLWLDTGSLWALDLQRLNSVLQQGLATPEHAAFARQLALKKL